MKRLVALVCLTLACLGVARAQDGSPPPNPNYTRFRGRASSAAVPTPPTGTFNFYYNTGSGRFEYKNSANTVVGLGTGTGSVTNVALSLPAIFTVSGSPVTSTGTLTGTLATQTANAVFAGPTSGGAATPTFRALVAADATEILGVSDLTDFSGKSGSGTTAIGATISSPSTNQVLTWDGSKWVNQAASAGGSTFSFYDAEKAPSSPSSLDDEFNAGALDAKWTLRGDTANTTETFLSGHLRWTKTTATITRTDMWQVLPSSGTADWTAIAHVSVDALPTSGSNYVGVVLFADIVTNPTTSNAVVFVLGRDSGFGYRVYLLTNVSTFSATVATHEIGAGQNFAYLKMVKTASGISYYASMDGVGWDNLIVNSTAISNPKQIGVCHLNNQSLLFIDSVDWFRLYTTGDPGMSGGLRTISTP